MIPQATLVAMTVGQVVNDDGDEMSLSAGSFVAYAARVSNPGNQFSEWSYNRLLAYLRRAHHWSPFEMSNAVIQIVTTRDISHQFIRHHSFRFQEFSQRYAEATKFHVFMARRQDQKNRQNSIDDLDEETKAWWIEQQQSVISLANGVYQEALSKKIAKECARKVLPEGLTETTFYANGYLRSWIHYLSQRLDPATQKEHRDVAVACEEVLRANIPEVFDIGDGDVETETKQ